MSNQRKRFPFLIRTRRRRVRQQPRFSLPGGTDSECIILVRHLKLSWHAFQTFHNLHSATDKE